MSAKRIIAQDRSVALGLDVDYQTSALVVLETSNGEVLHEGRLPHDPEAWLHLLERLPQCKIWACYETGGIGFYLCRMLCSLGVDCHVVPVSKIPKAPESRQQKTDRRDAMSLAQLYYHAPRTFVRVPSEQEEADRQLIRTREQLLKDRMRVQLRIKAFLVFHHVSMPPGLKVNWSSAYRRWLQSRPSREELLNDLLQVLLDQLKFLEKHTQQVNRKIIALSRTERYREACHRLVSQIHGVGLLTAMTFLCEVFRPHEFKTAEALAAHVGLTPCEYSSGKRHRYGHITHWGPPHLRKMLIEAAWTWVRKDAQARQRFLSLRAGCKPKIAIVAMARRLAIVLWAMTVKEQEYQYHWAA
jgi:transposase